MSNTCVQSITESQFSQEVLQESRPVLIDFYAEWCRPCNAVAPVLEEICSTNASLKVVKVDIEHARGIAIKHKIKEIPTFVLYRGGNPIAQTSGHQPKQRLEAWIQNAIGSTN